ncbi:MAG: Hsp20/alpha crystallin family protein [Deltaproteobacteria bacterium]|nr:Hsp20/alpha crystallin family protein [Deltaproteobacteria bacterium]
MAANFSLVYGLPCLLDRLMDRMDFLPIPAPHEIGARHFPPLQIIEDEDALYVRAIVPGIALEDIHLTLEGKTLTVSGIIPFLPGCHLRRDRPIGPFKREINLPFPVEADGISAVISNGLLTVTLPKTGSGAKRSIPVEYSGKEPL